MPELTETSLIADLARDTVRQVAPQELPRFRAASQASKASDYLLAFVGNEP